MLYVVLNYIFRPDWSIAQVLTVALTLDFLIPAIGFWYAMIPMLIIASLLEIIKRTWFSEAPC